MAEEQKQEGFLTEEEKNVWKKYQALMELYHSKERGLLDTSFSSSSCVKLTTQCT